MNKKLFNIMLVDDNSKFRDALKNVLEEDGTYKVVGSYWDGISIVEKVKKLKPDILILDILLPFTDGLSMIESIMDDEFSPKPTIVVVSAITSEKIVKQAINYGVAYYVAKPCTPQNVLQSLNVVLCDSNNSTKVISDKTLDKNEIIKKSSEKLLKKLGMQINLKGYKYILYGITQSVINKELLENVTKGIYKEISNEFNVTKQSAEIAMRRVIAKTFETGNTRELKKLFNGMKDKNYIPSCSLFLNTCADAINQENINIV